MHNITFNSSKIHIFPSAHGTFSRADHMLGQKASLYKFRKIEIIFNIFFEDNNMKLEITNRSEAGNLNIWWIEEEIKREIKKNLETKIENENGNST